MEKIFEKPSMGKITGGAMSLGSGVVGGVVVKFLSNMIGSSTLGQVGAALLGLAVLPSNKGEVLATVIGYNLGLGLNIGSLGGGSRETATVIR